MRIAKLGKKRFVAHSEEGSVRNIVAQVCEVKKPLLSVKKVSATGSRVVFDNDGSYIESKQTGENMCLREQGGMFMLEMYVQRGSTF